MCWCFISLHYYLLVVQQEMGDKTEMGRGAAKAPSQDLNLGQIHCKLHAMIQITHKKHRSHFSLLLNLIYTYLQ